MKLEDWLRWVFHAVTSARLRSLLTALGISIGIAEVTLLTSIGEGIRLYMMDSFSQFGTRIIAITPGKTTTSGIPALLTTIRPLSLQDAEALAHLPHVDAVIPFVQGTAKIEGAIFVRTHEFARPKDLSPNTGHGHHWFGNAESYFLVGDALGKAALRLIEN